MPPCRRCSASTIHLWMQPRGHQRVGGGDEQSCACGQVSARFPRSCTTAHRYALVKPLHALRMTVRTISAVQPGRNHKLLRSSRRRSAARGSQSQPPQRTTICRRASAPQNTAQTVSAGDDHRPRTSHTRMPGHPAPRWFHVKHRRSVCSEGASSIDSPQSDACATFVATQCHRSHEGVNRHVGGRRDVCPRAVGLPDAPCVFGVEAQLPSMTPSAWTHTTRMPGS